MFQYSLRRVQALYAMHRTEVFFLMRYGITGGTGAVIQVAGLYLWVSVLHLREQYLWGVVLAYTVAVVVTFLMQKYWTFRDYIHSLFAKQMLWYIAISLGNLGLNALILHAGKVAFEAAGIDYFSGWYLLVQVGAIGTVAVVSFLSNRYITFRVR